MEERAGVSSPLDEEAEPEGPTEQEPPEPGSRHAPNGENDRRWRPHQDPTFRGGRLTDPTVALAGVRNKQEPNVRRQAPVRR